MAVKGPHGHFPDLHLVVPVAVMAVMVIVAVSVVVITIVIGGVVIVTRLTDNDVEMHACI